MFVWGCALRDMLLDFVTERIHLKMLMRTMPKQMICVRISTLKHMKSKTTERKRRRSSRRIDKMNRCVWDINSIDIFWFSTSRDRWKISSNDGCVTNDESNWRMPWWTNLDLLIEQFNHHPLEFIAFKVRRRRSQNSICSCVCPSKNVLFSVSKSVYFKSL